MIKVDLPWSESRELDAPDSSIALIKDQYRDSAYGWILELLTRCTQDLEEKVAREFWSGVTGREASLALFLLAQHIWEDNLNDVPQIALCRAEHETEIDDLDWSEFAVTPAEKIGTKSFMHDLKKPLGDLSQVKGTLPTLAQLKQIESSLGKGEESAFNELFRMTLRNMSGDKILNLQQIQQMGLVDRRIIKNILNGDDQKLVDTTFNRPCSECSRKAYGVLNLRGFF